MRRRRRQREHRQDDGRCCGRHLANAVTHLASLCRGCRRRRDASINTRPAATQLKPTSDCALAREPVTGNVAGSVTAPAGCVAGCVTGFVTGVVAGLCTTLTASARREDCKVLTRFTPPNDVTERPAACAASAM